MSGWTAYLLLGIIKPPILAVAVAFNGIELLTIGASYTLTLTVLAANALTIAVSGQVLIVTTGGDAFILTLAPTLPGGTHTLITIGGRLTTARAGVFALAVS